MFASEVDEGTYDFRVRTCKATGCGSWSGIRSFYIDRLTPKPGDKWPMGAQAGEGTGGTETPLQGKDETGNVIARMSFDAFGQRRVAADWNEGFPFSTELDAIRDITTRGYTDHQMVDSVSLIHMNGRIYDPELGRFLSADPFIPNPFKHAELQSLQLCAEQSVDVGGSERVCGRRDLR